MKPGTWRKKRNEIALPLSDSNKKNEFPAAATEDIQRFKLAFEFWFLHSSFFILYYMGL